MLFAIPPADIDKPQIGTSHAYNNFGEDPEARTTCTGYAGGHAGTDMQTKDVEGAATADRGVFSLTDRKVLRIDTAIGRVFVASTLVVEGRLIDVTVGYLHLRSIAVRPGDRLVRGSLLGIQGNLGLGLPATDTTTREHVHIASAPPRHPPGAACGASPADARGKALFGALDPPPFFAVIVSSAVAQ